MTDPTGLKSSVIDQIKEILKTHLQKKDKYQVFIFGSRSRNSHKQYSDLDLLIQSEPSLTSREISQLHEIFEESELAIKVDVLTPENCLPAYQDKIRSEKKLWFESTTN